MFAVVGASLTTEIIDQTTDTTPYSIDRIRTSTKIAAVGSAYYAVEHLLTTKTPTRDFELCDADNCTDLLATKEVDVVIGPYATLLEARERALAKNPNTPIYVTGDELSNERIFAYYLVYCKDHFKDLNFVDLLEEAISRARAEGMVEVNSINLPLSKRGVRRSKDKTIPAFGFVVAVCSIVLAYIVVQISSCVHRGNRTKKAVDLTEGMRVRHAMKGEGVICRKVSEEGKPYGVQYDSGEKHAYSAKHAAKLVMIGHTEMLKSFGDVPPPPPPHPMLLQDDQNRSSLRPTPRFIRD